MVPLIAMNVAWALEPVYFGGTVPEVPRPPSMPRRHLRQLVTADHLQ